MSFLSRLFGRKKEKAIARATPVRTHRPPVSTNIPVSHTADSDLLAPLVVAAAISVDSSPAYAAEPEPAFTAGGGDFGGGGSSASYDYSPSSDSSSSYSSSSDSSSSYSSSSDSSSSYSDSSSSSSW